LALAALVVTGFRNPLFRGNFGVVAEGRVYRSAQPDEALPELIAERHIATILNLRGGSPDDPFYANEVKAARAGQVAFFDLPMSASKRPSRRELLVLLDLFDRCQYPLLIHCKSGSDRTGLASGLYLMARQGTPPREALRAFSLYYGHVPLLGPERLHEPFVEYAAWLESHGLTHTPDRLRSWVEREYRSEAGAEADAEVFLPLPEGPRARYQFRAAR
jgi:protein tyrosine/serine phosphatase